MTDREEAAARLCSDCNWYGAITGLYSYGCTRPTSERRSVAFGYLVDRLDTSAERERKPGRTWFGLGRERCGPDAQYWEPSPLWSRKQRTDRKDGHE